MSSPPSLNDKVDEPSQGSEALAKAFGMGRPSEEFVMEQPTMRAVAMRSGPSLALPPPKFGLAKPPPLGFARPPKGLSRPSSVSQRRESFGVQQVWDGAAPSSVWDVKAEDLEMVPEDFPLERTHRVIDGVKASVVAARISETLRSHSIEAEYDGKAAKAKCKTNDFVSFRIRLFAGGENGDPVVVEVQRRCGSASSFMRSCRAILASAEGKEVTPTARKMPPFAKKPIGEMKCLQEVAQKQPTTEETATEAMDRVLDMLRSMQRDSNILALENLAALTDPIKTSPAVAMRVSKCIVLGDDKYDVREEIRVLTERDGFEDSGAEEEDGATKHAEHLRQLALNVFANALSMCSKDGCLEKAVEEQTWFSDYLLPSLVDEVKRSENNACNACQAVSCIHSLVLCSRTARRLLSSHGGLDALQDALVVGEASHELLASETKRCLKTLDSLATTA